MKEKYLKNAFTLAETVIVLAVIGFLAVILLRSLDKLQPDREKTMFKKAYQLTERTVGELVNDESIYPYDRTRIGFYNKDSADIEGTSISFDGDEKFCQFFARKLNIFSDPVWDEDNKQCTFTTTDGMSWIVPSNFDNATVGAEVSRVQITVDINGKKDDGGKGPDTRDDDNPNRDIYDILVDFDGRVTVEGATELKYLKSHAAMKNDSI